MKEKIISPGKDFELKTRDEGDHSADEIQKFYSYWFAYADPFMPMIDLAPVFDEISKMVKSWFLEKGESTINYKNNSRENR